MDSFLQRLHAWNKRLNDLPRKGLLIAVVLGTCFLAVALFPLCWPFVVALLFAMMMEPLVRLLRKAFAKVPVGKNLATIVSMAVVFGLLFWLVRMILSRLVHELLALARAAPDLIKWISNVVTEQVGVLVDKYSYALPENILEITNQALNEVSKQLLSLAGSVSRTIATGAWATAMSVPMMLLSIVLTIMATYYFSSDKDRIFGFFRNNVPAVMLRKGTLLRKNIFKALFGQAKSQILVSMLTTALVIVGMMIMQRPYGLLIGLLIGVADALPVLGAGLFLIPWSLFGFVVSDTTTGVGMALLYVAVVVMRQIAEPRIVGKNLGLYPLATMMAIFAGYRITGGVLGMLLGPILLNICKVVLEADRADDVPLPPASRLKLVFKRHMPEGEKPSPGKDSEK